MSVARFTSQLRVILTAAILGTFFVLPASDARANAPVGESLWRQAEVATNGDLSELRERRESNGFTFSATGTPRAVTLQALGKGGGSTYGVTFDLPGKADLLVGQVYSEGLDMDYPDCEAALDGAFQIHELEFDPDTSEITHFSATYHHFCSDSVPDGTRTVATVAYEPANGALPLPKYGSLNGEPLTKLTLRFDHSHIEYGHRAVARGVLSVRGTEDTLADQKIVVSKYVGFHRWNAIEATRTDSRGRYALGFRPDTTERYQVKFPGSSVGTESTSFERQVYVHFAIAAHLSDRRVKVGEPLTVAGRVKPGSRDLPRVILQERVNGSWVNVMHVGPRRDGMFQMRIVVNSVARVKLRVYCDAKLGLEHGVSKSMHLVAR